jgi:hypothetical protein
MSKLAEDMEHHVDMRLRQSAALRQHPRLLRQDVEIEPKPVPGDDGMAFGSLGCQVLNQAGGFLTAHPVRRKCTVIAAMPEDWLVGIASQGCRTGDSQWPAGLQRILDGEHLQA